VRAVLPERPLAWADTDGGGWLVGTRHGLVSVLDGAAVAVRWEDVQRADWDHDTATLRVEEVQDYGRPARHAAYVLEGAGALLALVRDRVTASIVAQRRVAVAGTRGFTVVGRRSPTGDGPVTWSCEFDRGVDPADPDVRSVAEAALADVRESVGL
jgi:hypothetical protein